MATPPLFPHLQISIIQQDKARPKRITRPEDFDAYPQTTKNLQDRASHSRQLTDSAEKVLRIFEERRIESTQKTNVNLLDGTDKTAQAGIAFLLEVEASADLDWLRSAFGFHIVSEEEQGYVIVATQDVDLSRFREKLDGFMQDSEGTKQVAKLYRINEDDTSRQERILSPSLLDQWAAIHAESIYIVDVGISCGSDVIIPASPRREDDETEEHYEDRQTNWRERREKTLLRLNEIKVERQQNFINFLHVYQPVYLSGLAPNSFPGDSSDLSETEKSKTNLVAINGLFLDSFTVRLSLSGIGLRDLVLNYPYVFMVTEIEQCELPASSMDGCISPPNKKMILTAPSPDAPAVCVIDSGIQEEHGLLSPAIDCRSSLCFIPNISQSAVSDYVQNGGHGTRVAGLILYPNGIPNAGQYTLPFWIQNARVLNSKNQKEKGLILWEVLPKIVDRFQHSPRRTRIFNQSIAHTKPHTPKHMSPWAATMDALSYENDVLFIQAAGNLPTTSDNSNYLGVREYLAQGARYPDYLREPSCRIPEPAQSLQALTVGSIIHRPMNDGTYYSLGVADQPSSLSRAGLGIWGCIKPDVVERGGDYARDANEPPNVIIHPRLAPEMVKATSASNSGSDRGWDSVGTSFAAPKVTHIAAAIEALFPEEPTLLYRALIAQSARWPHWAENEGDKDARCRILQHIGYGIPDKERATRNDDYRITFISHGEQRVNIGQAHIYEIAIPNYLRDPGNDHDIRIDITVSYAASPRPTRQNMRGYLAANVEWDTIRIGEDLDDFTKRIFFTSAKPEGDNKGLPWFLHRNADYGQLRGTNRNQSTLQKDWALTKSSKLPEKFAIAVIGRRGWSNDPETYAKYAMAVTIEAPKRDVRVYEPISMLAINNVEFIEQLRLPFEIGV